MKTCGHKLIEHTADLALELWAETEPALLEEGARALVAVLTEDAPVAENERRELSLEALDREDRLVQFLNEVLVAAITDGFLTTRAELRLAAPARLQGTLLGEANAGHKIQTELKSVTYHALELVQQAGRWQAFVVIDV